MGAVTQKIVLRWRTIAAIVFIVKLATVFLSSPTGDLANWAGIANIQFGFLAQGRVPPVAATGVYGYMGLILTPFFWLWTILPINHPPLDDLVSSSAPALYLNLLLRTPLFIADVSAGILIMKLVRIMTGSQTKGRIAFLAWIANPFNIYWINWYGAVDVIPASIVLLAIYLALKNRSFLSGFSLAIGGLLRIFPFLSFPFLLFSLRGKSVRSITYLCLGFLLPPIVALISLYLSKAGSLEAVTLIPTRQLWLLDFLGTSLVGQDVKSAIVVVILQLLVCVRFWNKHTALDLVTVSILALFISSLAYAGSAHHFVWVSPLLTISVATNPKEIWIFLLTFASAFGITYPFQPDTIVLGPFLVGLFYGAKAIYLLKINQESIYNDAAETRAFNMRT